MDILFLIIVASLIGVFVALAAYFSCAETAYTGLNSIRIKNLAQEGHKNADKALKIYENYDALLITTLVGNNIMNVATSTLGTMLFTELLGITTGVIVALVFMATVILLFAEITPKAIAKRNAERYALKTAGSLQMVILILTPISWVFSRFTNYLLRNVKDDSAEVPCFTEDELHVMIEEVIEEGALERSEGELVKSAMQFDDIKVSEMYTPRANIIAAELRTNLEDLKTLFLEHEYSRIPIYEGTVDRIIGLVNSKEFFAKYLTEDEDFAIIDIIRPVKFVPENTNIAALLKELQKTHIHIAIVLDNFGRTLGLVSMEDILEELVGEIWDEKDEAGFPIVEEKDGSYIVPGDANIVEVMKRIGLEFNAGEFKDSSISQFISKTIDRVPHKGDVVDVEGTKIIVRSMKSRRVKEARIRPGKKDLNPPETQES